MSNSLDLADNQHFASLIRVWKVNSRTSMQRVHRGDRGEVLHGAKWYIQILKNMTSYISSQMLRSKQALDPPCFPVDPKQIRTTVTIYHDVKAFSDMEVNFQNIFQCRFTM